MASRYPERARDEGVEGYATVAVVLSATGEVTATELLREAPEGYGFGDACAAALRDPDQVWTPAHDAAGQAIEARLSFRCTFRQASSTASQ